MQENKALSAYRLRLKDRIIETAMQSFARRGVRAVKMDDIAQQLAISKRTLYELYGNKEDLLFEGVKKLRNQKARKMHQQVERCKNVMEIILYVYREKVEEFKQTVPEFYADISRYPHVMELLEEERIDNHKQMLQFLKRGCDEGYFRSDVDYEIVAVLFDAIGQYIMSQELYRQYTIEQLFQNLVFISLRGFCTTQGIEILDRILQHQP